MSVIVKNMNMPENCGDCMFCYDGICVCVKDAGSIDVDNYYYGTKRPGNCPLIELPDHGDLIDKDALMAHKGSAYDIDGHELYAVGTGTILRMPVVIPAERSEDVTG